MWGVRFSALVEKQAQVELPFRDRRTPVEAAGHGTREPEEAVDDAILAARHATHHARETVERRDERDELEALLVDTRPRHRAADHERRGCEAFLGAALHVRRFRRVLELLVRLRGASDDVVAFLFGKRLESR